MILRYNQKLKGYSRRLRRETTDAEDLMWFHIRRKQLNNIQFYRQKPIGNYIVDFYGPKAKLVIEIDGSQHFEKAHQARDKQRDNYLVSIGLKVLRFDNLDVLENMGGVIDIIDEELKRI